MSNIRLSYVISTRNKLFSLRGVLEQLCRERQPDEEIIIADGDSNDGTREYLLELLARGDIQWVISEPDFGEAHGYNKAMMMAKGELIKIISDDDAFYWPGIRSCREYMLAHPEIDLLAANGGSTGWRQNSEIMHFNYIPSFEQWCIRQQPFGFCGLGLMLRRDSLALLGLFDPHVIRVDQAYSFRVTSGPLHMALYTGCLYVRILNPESNSYKGSRVSFRQDSDWSSLIYLGETPVPPSIMITFRKAFRNLIKHWQQKITRIGHKDSQPQKINDEWLDLNVEWPQQLDSCRDWLDEWNTEHLASFLVGSTKESDFRGALYARREAVFRKLH